MVCEYIFFKMMKRIIFFLRIRGREREREREREKKGEGESGVVARGRK